MTYNPELKSTTNMRCTYMCALCLCEWIQNDVSLVNIFHILWPTKYIIFIKYIKNKIYIYLDFRVIN